MAESANKAARVRRRGSLVGGGCAIQGLGILLGALLLFMIPVVGWVLGPIVTLGMLMYGSRKAISYECSACKNPVASKRVLICPACQVSFRR